MATEEEAFAELFAPLETPAKEWPATIIHYTSGEAFFQICKSRKIQFSASSATNDAAEVWGALAILNQHAASSVHQAWMQEVKAVWSEFLPAFVPYFNALRNRMAGQLYLSCWCEADDQHPDGKLSMWRAYGADGRGMAIAIATAPFLSGREKTRVPLQFFKTRYEDDAALCSTLQHGADVFLKHIDLAQTLAEQEGIQAACWQLARFWIFACATRKHPGFREEREWRLLYCPELDGEDIFRKQLDVSLVRGQLRPRLLVDVRDYSDLGFPGSAFEELVQYAVIGPNVADKSSAWRATHMLLSGAGCPDAERLIRNCTTPYRSAV